MEYKTATIEELQKFVSDTHGELGRLRFSVAGSKNRNVKRVRTLRKDIARAETELSVRRHSKA